jgi:amidase
MKNAGATIVENANFSAWDEYVADENAPIGNSTIVLDADFVSNLASYLSQLTSNPNNIKSLADEANYTHHFALEDYPNRDTGVWEQSLSLGYNNSESRFWQAYQYSSYLGGEGGVLGALKMYNLDALILPTDDSPGLPARAGLPIVTVPLGFYPSNTTVEKSQRGLVEVGPNIPLVILFCFTAPFITSWFLPSVLQDSDKRQIWAFIHGCKVVRGNSHWTCVCI